MNDDQNDGNGKSSEIGFAKTFAEQAAIDAVRDFHKKNYENYLKQIEYMQHWHRSLAISATPFPTTLPLTTTFEEAYGKPEQEQFKFATRNRPGRPKFAEQASKQFGSLSEDRFPKFSKRLKKALKDNSPQALVLMLSALIDQGLRNILFYILHIETGCDTDTARDFAERYRVTEENFLKHGTILLTATDRKIKTPNDECEVSHYFPQCFGRILDGSDTSFAEARNVRHRIAHGNRVGGNLATGDIWQRISTARNAVCYQAVISMTEKIQEIDDAFVDCFATGTKVFKPFAGNIQGFTCKTRKMTPAQTNLLLSKL